MSDWALDNCDPPKPVGTMITHGTSDDARPYLGLDDFLLSVDEEFNSGQILIILIQFHKLSISMMET